MWAVDGTWERVFTALVAQADAEEDLNWDVSVDSTTVRAHQHAARARKRGPRPANPATTPSAAPAAD
jgi:transposase